MNAPKNIGGYRHYNCNGDWYPSVTTILGETNPAKMGYAKWRKSNPTASEAATSRGTSLHEYCERWLKDGAEPALNVSDAVSPYVASITPVLAQISGVLCLEQFVWHRGQRFAGTLDCCARIGGKLTLIDWKTTCKLPKSDKAIARHLADYRLQVAAYAVALQDTKGVEVEQLAIAVAHPDGPALLEIIEGDRINNLWLQFIGRRAQFEEILMERRQKEQTQSQAIVTAFQWGGQ